MTALVIAHRGASGYLPEHTLAAYSRAIEQGADYIEPDLVMTRDGVLVARHENEIGGTTDVATRAEFAGRRTTRSVDGVTITGWFTEDFTLAELKQLRARERIPHLRPDNTRFDAKLEVPTFDEVLKLVCSARDRGRRVGVYPETKHPSYFAARGLPLEEPLLAALSAHGLGPERSAVFIQSFEVDNLRALRRRTGLPLVQLVEAEGSPFGHPRTYDELMTRAGLSGIAEYADAIGVHKQRVIPRRPDGTLGVAGRLVHEAHAAGLAVHAWTFRRENEFLPTELRSGADPAAPGDLLREIELHLHAGVDGVFVDHPDLGKIARERFAARATSRA